MEWEIVIGLETHAQLSTKSKIFSGSSTAFGAEPNTQANAVDMALPGTLPVMNYGAVERAIAFGIAVDAKIAPISIFARKHYFYPDLPKNYQTSQYEDPTVVGGKVRFFVDETEHTVNLTRAHLEEDAGKSLHEDFEGPLGEKSSGIDLNRTGTPLLEIVTEPEIRSAAEAVAYARALHSLVVWLGVCDGNMQEGSFRCDVNISVRPKGSTEFGTRTEIKNLNSFKFMEKAIQYEARRQIELIEDGGKVIQETRLYDDIKDETRSMRTKEDAHDYRYFPCPDLPPLHIDDAWIQKVRTQMPELPQARRDRYSKDYGLSDYHCAQLTQTREMADYFEKLLALAGVQNAQLVANWIMGDISASLNRDELSFNQSPISIEHMASLIKRIEDKTISSKIAKDVFQSMWSGENGGDPDAIIEAKGLKQINDSSAIGAMIDEVLAENAEIVAEYKAGKQKAFNSLVGKVMKVAKGKANPAQVNEVLLEKLK
ncbi:Asp-tRNA(Asn)/Glu-tRNA(Gln) amidotransferase subunit GatB [Taylorella equigenitalis]|uniref:Aspartyl/glutamyl-tRNA(Asn/Gln) amidotransferase subunit B n=2 Tax=Taylorella equigenitalis TaxID=29575 RepID=A0A654KIJ3_TAYEM|nr:Asp-tRNA(Asn)/Glu-tRNA(Gln) amidotransferase subunit GatB [Taylorella equigenitalis]ADU91716.1 Aspartyl-tRNA(Asn),Glutamyl-tRNA(Gln) amidotransferase subunit B [Taylorella equigenitalis MCE9]AFN35284.1 aspartyl/glutamyl-tRNA(asn/gln) amidotransferase subunit B [Taylorella equigenitalis ATCC 35865]ASY29949.1 aspartyl/glutamyl-tRNA amidotransferase subunit B [Taylorella equigenitalis]ASY37251.1 Asp-tRNA(Asn)/Glu-tRNA(Gln) amidotransferase GatCAB subunit B [Taylorella equigenitalis]ASY38717.1 